MKKALVLVLSFILLILFVSVGSAAVTVGGNFRAWYQTAADESLSSDSSISTFRFDRMAFCVTADNDQKNGFTGGFQYFQIGKNNSSSTDIRVDSGYFYQKAIFSDNDELDFGYFKLPFGIEKDFKFISLDNTLSGLVMGSAKKSVGIKYQGKAGVLGYGFALADANNSGDYNMTSDKNNKGFDYSARLTITPINNLRFGLGYLNDAASSTDSDSKNKVGVFDTLYGFGPFGFAMEYVSLTPDSMNTMTGTYTELSYKMNDTFSAYAGRAVSLSGDNNGEKLIDYMGDKSHTSYYTNMFVLGSGSGAGYNFALKDNWTVIGAKYQLAAKTTLQGEFLKQDGDDAKWIGGVRLMIEF